METPPTGTALTDLNPMARMPPIFIGAEGTAGLTLIEIPALLSK